MERKQSVQLLTHIQQLKIAAIYTVLAVTVASCYKVELSPFDTSQGGETLAVATEVAEIVENASPSFRLNYAGAPFTFTKDVAITPVDPTVSGTPTSYSVLPALPAGLTIDTTTGQLAGTPTVLAATATHTVTATNGTGDTTFDLTITVNDAAPSALNYTGAPFTFTNGAAITPVNPTITGTPISYSVLPALPAGLTIHNTTGQLAGTPTAATATATYTVTATNSGGSTTFDLTITVDEVAPSALGYAGAPFTFTKDVAITPVNPTVTGTATSYSVLPALPTGLVIDTTTGQLAGTPTVITATATYTVTASNVVGNTTFDLTITVNDAPPSALSYAGTPFTFTKDVTITPVNPTITGTPTSYSVLPALPTGLAINTTTGQLAGTPTVTATAATYTVTATNSGGSTTFNLNITVNDAPPSALSYAGAPFTFSKDVTIISVNPTVTGTPISYSVSPALPTGLAINTTTGQLAGTPTVTAALATYTVTATNSGGSTAVDLEITVNETPPSALSYAGNPFVFNQNWPITPVDPTVTGTPSSYSVTPALPTGLAINTTTGQLAGTPTGTAALATYTVTATNAGGSTTFDLTITVDPPATQYQTNCATWKGLVTGEVFGSGSFPSGGFNSSGSWGLGGGGLMTHTAAYQGYGAGTYRGGATSIANAVLEFTNQNSVTLNLTGSTPAYQTDVCFRLETRDTTSSHLMRMTLSDGTSFEQTQSANGFIDFGFVSPNQITSIVITCVNSDCNNQFGIGDLWHTPN